MLSVFDDKLYDLHWCAIEINHISDHLRKFAIIILEYANLMNVS